MPRLWTTTVEEHRREVREAVLDAAASLVAEHGLRSVTMTGIAETTGIGRATLYKYFPDVEAILTAWHERQVVQHLTHLAQVRAQAGNAGDKLVAVLSAYASMPREHHGDEIAVLLHRSEHVVRAHRQLRALVRDLLKEGADAGAFRADVPPDELASYCLHALEAARRLGSKAAVRRLVTVTLAGLRPVAPAGRGDVRVKDCDASGADPPTARGQAG